MPHRLRRRQGFVEAVLYIAVLVVVWVFLWDSVSVLTVLTGLVVALGVTRLFYLPPIELSGRINVLYGAWFVVWFCAHVLAASFQVAWLSFRPKPVAAGSVVAVDLATRSDLLITLVTMVNGLIPGSLVIEIDRARAVVFVHVLNCADEEEMENARRQTHRIEHLLICTLGSPHDVQALNEAREAKGLPPVLESRTIRARALRAKLARQVKEGA
ncbi:MULTISPECIES: Na+/H+ antiporter subunit E [Brevibacterium]|jgi:multicomponent Na+:H+ antiporter subunit E|uniref:Na+/H+ antiporter subunit E n=1 Tax=Brevibacterium salitolerans TaxID=1403566 RepID=A0ABN2WNN2_9MICO|nr:Na+/H+ antiporter subunit E [Brevibacterium sp.]